MAYLDTKTLFFTTSPRTPIKMIPEIKVLKDDFVGKEWNKTNQIDFIDVLSKTEFFEGIGSTTDKAFSARDRINRAPKALGFVDLKPIILITDAGNALLSGKRTEEVFLRQLLKFQLPSPYHIEKEEIRGSFFVKPYLEIFRLIRELEYLTFDEVKIFCMQLVDYRKIDAIKALIRDFRVEKEKNKGNYKNFVNQVWEDNIKKVFSLKISAGKYKTRESKDETSKKFIQTKKSNFRDYADACFRYLRSTGLVNISHRNYTISIDSHKTAEVDYFLSNTNRNPVFINDEIKFKQELFNSKMPTLFYDNKENLIHDILRISSYNLSDLNSKSVDELKDLKDELVQNNRDSALQTEIAELKSYSLYSEIIDTYNEIISKELYDYPLMLEWNTWRAMTMLDGGLITGNFKRDDNGEPMNTAPGNMSDIVCDYGDFALAVEVTMQSGQRQYEAEGEPVARHYGKLKKLSGKDTFCLFIAPTINSSTLAHFYGLNKIDIEFYGGKSKIIPIELDVFMKMVENSYNYDGVHDSNLVKKCLQSMIDTINEVKSEAEWMLKITEQASNWLSPSA